MFRKFIFISLSCLLILNILVPSVLHAEADQCSEEKLRNLGILALNCDGDKAKCEIPAEGAPTSDTKSPSNTLKDFVDKYAEGAYKNSLSSGVPYDFSLGQGILESGYGKSELSSKYYNFFGIKAGKAWTGQTVTMRTREEVNGGSVYVNAPFRAYPSPESGFADHDKFLRENKRYAAAFQYSNDPYKFLVEIKKAGYATDSGYVKKVWTVIQSVQQYIATSGKYPPSSGVKYAIKDPTETPNVVAPSDCTDASLPNSDIGIIKSADLPTSGPMKPTGIILHWWGGTGGISSLISTLKSRGLSVQIATTQDGLVHQLTSTIDTKASHAKCANGWAIGNEIEGGVKTNVVGGQVIALDLAENDKQFQSVVNITEKLMALYNIPIDGEINSGGTSGSGVHSHKEVDKYCSNGSGKSDVDDIYLKRVKDELRKRATSKKAVSN